MIYISFVKNIYRYMYYVPIWQPIPNPKSMFSYPKNQKMCLVKPKKKKGWMKPNFCPKYQRSIAKKQVGGILCFFPIGWNRPYVAMLAGFYFLLYGQKVRTAKWTQNQKTVDVTANPMSIVDIISNFILFSSHSNQTNKGKLLVYC